MKKIVSMFAMILAFSYSASARTTALDSLLAVISQKYKLAGMSVTVTRDSTIVFSQGYGFRDIARQLPVDQHTKYRIASISKLITATALMQLYEQGQFALDDHVSQYLGFDLKNPGNVAQPITFKMLLSHTSSLRDGSGYDRFLSDSYSKTPPPAIRELLVPGGAYYTSDMFDASRTPDKKYFHYANINFGVLGTLVERISGERFDRYCKKHLFDLLGMISSFNVRDLPDINDVAVLYRKSGSTWNPQADFYNGIYPPERDLSGYKIGDNGIIFGPQGGLRTSSNDLAKFMIAHQQGGRFQQARILNDTTIARMHEIIWKYNGTNGDNYYGIFNSYALGNHTTINLLPGQKLIGHPGEAYGLISDLYFSKEGNYGIIFITNGGSWGSGSYSGWYNIEEDVFKTCLAQLPGLIVSVSGNPDVTSTYQLAQNYPNPFNPSTTINYHLPRATHVWLTIVSINGEEVKKLVQEYQTAGMKSVRWDGLNEAGQMASSGIYIYQIKTDEFSSSKKLLLLR